MNLFSTSVICMSLKYRANSDPFGHKIDELFYIIKIKVNSVGLNKRREHRNG